MNGKYIEIYEIHVKLCLQCRAVDDYQPKRRRCTLGRILVKKANEELKSC